MFKKFYPGEYYSSAFDINFRSYFEKGYRAALFDIDNTIVGHDAPYDDNAVSFFKDLKSMGFKVCLISNNDEARVRPFAQGVGAQYIYGAGKPKAQGYLKAADLLGCKKNETLFVGDQIFTDILGANNAGIYSILVKPLGKDPIFRIKLKRIGEKIILFFYQNSKYCNKRF